MKQLKSVILLLFLFLFSGCLYFDYGVDKEEIKLPYRTYYHSERDHRFDFNTVLYSREGAPKGKYGYIDFVIQISHLYKEIHETEDKGNYISEIRFLNFTTDDDIKIDTNSIKLLHKDSKGRIVPFIKIKHDLDRKPETKYRNHYYRKIYNSEVLPDFLDEYIFLEFYIDGKKQNIEYKLPIKKKLHYTWWNVMMSI